MPQIRVKSKAEDLARVRNNQRNCRARQKEYVRDLEQKVQFYETVQNTQIDDLRKKMELLSVENQLLKYFVESVTSMVDSAFEQPLAPSWEACGPMTGSELGLDVLVSSEYLISSNSVPGATNRLGGTQSVPGNDDPSQEENTMTSHPSLSDLPPLDDRLLYMSTQLPASTVRVSESLNCPQMGLMPYNGFASEESQLSTSGYPAMDCNLGTSDPFSQHTLSCSEACELLIGYVRRKPDLRNLHLRLRSGYRNSLVPGEGCRVDYYQLLAVLSDTS
ncbi:hypothetical protein N7499_005296 [Penicillium canescens]|uniref:BZIP domain-containing protein n=1 Tax=Penicillium canescens TaxID=5083 RepID=A0AAD6N3C2_PENCN|nr:uncharacterized protein N7446_004191 [Penicillium canescens]KAJ6027209.1 hypothetical protein N7460_012026 [Penicillium canescens]KAJ6040491.1 hypothetical protein N7444_009396 [Penicillium canescens]KAJ6067154.1 hypothetical protein N7446_004191 [Penicillium canescens]KAJ6085667.1 hypothetical protein N7499_005296 [Penicillium canescens]KAJ6162440.1 hypothetical protein N7485_010670 [Penicillium canescens]